MVAFEKRSKESPNESAPLTKTEVAHMSLYLPGSSAPPGVTDRFALRVTALARFCVTRYSPGHRAPDLTLDMVLDHFI